MLTHVEAVVICEEGDMEFRTKDLMIRGSRGITRSHSSNTSRTVAHTHFGAPTWSGNNREQFRPILYHITKKKSCLFSLHASTVYACLAATIIDHEGNPTFLRGL